MFLFDPNAYARNPAGVAESINKMVESVGGEIMVSRLWNEQKLAYPVNGHRKGVYWLAYCKLESTDLVKFNRQCQLNDRLMRHLMIKIDPRLVDMLIAASQGVAVESKATDADGQETPAVKENEKSDETPAETETASVES
jgi:small subunit ribosomal protein S6